MASFFEFKIEIYAPVSSKQSCTFRSSFLAEVAEEIFIFDRLNCSKRVLGIEIMVQKSNLGTKIIVMYHITARF